MNYLVFFKKKKKKNTKDFSKTYNFPSIFCITSYKLINVLIFSTSKKIADKKTVLSSW